MLSFYQAPVRRSALFQAIYDDPIYEALQQDWSVPPWFHMVPPLDETVPTSSAPSAPNVCLSLACASDAVHIILCRLGGLRTNARSAVRSQAVRLPQRVGGVDTP